MKKNKKIDIEIVPLSKTEQNLLKGGFVAIQNESYDPSFIKNTNCSKPGLFNRNCGCKTCCIEEADK